MSTRLQTPEINSSSMADIAFLLLTFFLITTTIDQPKGIMLLLPVYDFHPPDAPVHDRNLFTIQINSSDMMMVEGEPRVSSTGLRDEIRDFVLNQGRHAHLSDDPVSATISIKTDRGTSYKKFIEVLDEAQAAYFIIYADRAGLTPQQFRSLDVSNPNQRKIYDDARTGVPMNISIAEPTHVGANP